MDIRLEKSWKQKLQDEFSKQYFVDLIEFVRDEYTNHTIYPPGPYIFRALDTTPLTSVKVVIIGQDPYHGPGQANGLSFSVAEGVRIPPSLQNIYKEIEADLGIAAPDSGDLTRWAAQGVLMLNATLTVKAKSPGSHQNKGWEEFTDAVIKVLNDEKQNLVFLLWGKYAQKKGEIIDRQKHLVLESPHPSPFSANRGFFGNKHFSKTNRYLEEKGDEKVDW
jgi:uracil-DNA glycosylase